MWELEISNECLTHNDWPDKSSLGIYLGWFCSNSNFTPWDSLIRSSTSIRSIKFLSSVDKDRKISTISHKICVIDMMLDNSTTNNDLTRFLSFHRNIINQSEISVNITNKSLFSILIEIHDVSEGTICECWAKHGDVIFIAPVINTLFFFWMVLFIHLLTNSIGDRRWSAKFSVSRRLLFFMKLLNKWLKPHLKFRVVIIRNNQVSNSVMAHRSKSCSIECKVSDVMVSQNLHDIFFNTSTSCDDARNHLMLTKISNVFSHTTWCHVGSVSEEDGTSGVFTHFFVLVLVVFIFSNWLLWESPFDHIINAINRLTNWCGLETGMNQSFE